MNPRILLSHPSGNANVRQAAVAFAQANLLAEFWTGINWNSKHWVNNFLPNSVTRQLARRSFPDALVQFSRVYPWHEVSRLLADRIGISRWTSHESGILSSNACHVSLDKKIAERINKLPNISAVYAYDHCALESFRAARARGIKCIYDLPIGHWPELKRIIQEEIELQPEWAHTAPSVDFPLDIFSRKDAELKAADAVVVASSFTRNTLEKHLKLNVPVHVIPYGAPKPIQGVERTRRGPETKLKVLFVGALGIGKGVPYLLDAISKLGKSVDLTIVGRKRGNCRPLGEALTNHRWIPSLPHREVLEEMARHDVFVFPSLFDGFGLVILEALSQGLPVITTPNTGGPDVITEGEDGFIVPIRSSEAIVQKLELLNRDRNLLNEMSKAAQKKAALCTWADYRQRLVRAVEETQHS